MTKEKWYNSLDYSPPTHSHDHDHEHHHNHEQQRQANLSLIARFRNAVLRRNSQVAPYQNNEFFVNEEASEDSHNHHHLHHPREESHSSYQDELERSTVVDDEGHIHSHHHLHHHEEDPSFFNRLADQIKSVDGIDETAHLLGQILPGLAGPIATASILTFATPLVWLGVVGMRHEYQEAKEQFDEILQAEISTKEKLYNLAKLSLQQRKHLAQNLGIEFEETQEIPELNEQFSDFEFAELIHKNQVAQNKRMILAISKKYGWTGILGMSGMFAGMIPATAAASLEIADEITKGTVEALESAASIFEMVAGSFFLVGQVAMAVYAGSRAVQGKKGIAALKNNAEIFQKHATTIKPKNKEHIEQIIAKQSQFIHNHSVRYGKLTVAGQVFMSSGTIAGMTGVGLPVAASLLAVGAPLTIQPAISRIIWQEKESKFSGVKAKNNDFVLGFTKDYQPFSMFQDFADKNYRNLNMQQQKALQEKYYLRRRHLQRILERQNNYDRMLVTFEVPFERCCHLLACVKVLSIIHHLTNDKKYKNLSNDEKIKILEEKLNIGNDEAKIKGSGVEDKIALYAKDFYASEKEEIHNLFFSGTKNSVNKNLTDISLGFLETLRTGISVERLEDERRDELLELLDVKFETRHFEEDERKLAKFARNVLDLTKSSLKSIRFELANQMINCCFVKEMNEKYQESQVVLQSLQEPDSAVASSSSNQVAEGNLVEIWV